jgi:hypothetical protein
VGEGVEQGSDEHVAGDAAERVQVDVLHGTLTNEVSMFFSEEKNQKTFASGAADRYRTWPES